MKIVFTAIFGSYDTLAPISVPQGWRALCFTDSPVAARGWEVIPTEPVPKIFRHIKTCPHQFLPDHEISLWMDGNITPKMTLNHLVNGKSGYWLMEHPQRHSVWAEAIRCKELNKDNHEVIDAQVAKYRAEGYRDNYGLAATGVIIRTPGFEKFAQAWWDEVREHSVRDQISFPVIAQKYKLKYKTFPFMQNFGKIVHSGKR